MVTKERFAARKEESSRLRFFSGGSGAVLSAQEPINNVVRSTYQCLAAVFGGAQAIHVMAFDEALSIPTEESAKICLRTQQIIADESGVTKTVDPLGGSFFVEWLTDELEKQILGKMKEIEENWGGMPNAVVKGYPQREVIARAYQQEIDIESGERIVVGRNKYVSNEKQKIRIERPDEKVSSPPKEKSEGTEKKKEHEKSEGGPGKS